MFTAPVLIRDVLKDTKTDRQTLQEAQIFRMLKQRWMKWFRCNGSYYRPLNEHVCADVCEQNKASLCWFEEPLQLQLRNGFNMQMMTAISMI